MDYYSRKIVFGVMTEWPHYHLNDTPVLLLWVWRDCCLMVIFIEALLLKYALCVLNITVMNCIINALLANGLGIQKLTFVLQNDTF